MTGKFAPDLIRVLAGLEPGEMPGGPAQTVIMIAGTAPMPYWVSIPTSAMAQQSITSFMVLSGYPSSFREVP